MTGGRVALRVLADRTMMAGQAGFACFSIVEHAAWLALLLYAFDRGGVGEAGVVAFAVLVPAAILAPFASVLSDRLGVGSGLAVGFFLQAATSAATTVAMFIDASATVVYVAATLFTVALTLSRPTLAAVLPTISHGPAELAAANSIAGGIETIGSFIGPGLAGLVLVTRSPTDVFAICTLLLIVATVLALRIGSVEPDRTDDDEEEAEAEAPLAEIWGGLRLLRNEPEPRLIVALLSAAWLVLGALDVALVAVAVDLLGRDEATAGLLGSAVGVGGIVGAALSFALVGRRRLSGPVALGLIAASLPIAFLAATDSLALVVLLLGLAGAGDAISDIAGRTLLQGLAAQDTLARVFGVLEGLATAALAIGSIAFSLVAVWFGLTAAILMTGAVLPVILLFRFGRLAKIDRARPAVDPELLALIRRVPIFAPLPAFRAEQLLVNLRRTELQPDQVVFEQGDHGDQLYVVRDGTAVVELADREVEHGPGGFFGEIALVKDQPRMATVRAGGDGLVAYTLDRDVFLDAISNFPRSRSRTVRTADRRLDEG